LNQPNDLTFDSSGNLYVSNFGDSTISKVTTGGTVSTFVDNTHGLVSPVGVAFNPVSGNLFVVNQGSDSIFQVTPGGVVSSFATGINSAPQYLAFSPTAVPEPASYAAIAGITMLGLTTWRRRRQQTGDGS
jgi:DNA-binding beta-propeller fold protein YncE